MRGRAFHVGMTGPFRGTLSRTPTGINSPPIQNRKKPVSSFSFGRSAKTSSFYHEILRNFLCLFISIMFILKGKLH